MWVRKQVCLMLLAFWFPAFISADSVAEDGFWHIETKKGLKISSADDAHSLRVGGRLMWDYDDYQHADVGGEDDQHSEFRRAGLFLRGKVFSDWAYRLLFELSGDEHEDAHLEEASLRYRAWPVHIRVGRFKAPVGLERLSASKNLATIERAAFWNFVPGGRSDMNVQIEQQGDRYTWSFGLYENNEDLVDGFTVTDEEHTYSTAARVTWQAWQREDALLHLGASLMRHDFSDNKVRMRLRSRLGAHSSESVLLIDTGGLAEDADQWGVESALILGSVAFQGEYLDYRMFSDTGPDLDFSGAYLQGSWVITGEKRRLRDGLLKRVKPKHALGAWEVVLKYEYGEAEALSRTEYELYTLGVNWFLDRHWRVSLNAIVGELDDGFERDDSFDSLSGRLQFSF